MLVAPPPPADQKGAKVVKRLAAPKRQEQPVLQETGVNSLYGTPPDPALVSQPVGGAYYNDTLAPMSLPDNGGNGDGAPLPFFPPAPSDQIDQAARIVPPPAPQTVGDSTDQGVSVAPTIDNNDLLSRAIGVAGTPTPVEGTPPVAPTFAPPPTRNEAQEKSERQKRGVMGLVALGLAALLHGGPGALQGVAAGTNQGIQNLQSRQDESFGEKLHETEQQNQNAQQTFGNQQKTYSDAVARAHYTDAQNQDMVQNIAQQIKAEQDAGKSDTNAKQKMLDYWSKLTPDSQKSLQPLLGALGYDNLPIGIATQKDLTASERAGTGAANAAERGRHNLATEGIQQGTLQERIRNNKQLAGIHQEVADTTRWMDGARVNHMKATEGLTRAAQQARLTGNPLALQRLQVQGAQQQRLLRQEQNAYGARAANISLQISKLGANPTGDDEADKETLSKLTDAYYQAKQNIEYSKQEQEQLAQQLSPPIKVPPGAGTVQNNPNLPSVPPMGIQLPPSAGTSFTTPAGPIGGSVTVKPGSAPITKIKVPPSGKATPKRTTKAAVRDYSKVPTGEIFQRLAAKYK